MPSSHWQAPRPSPEAGAGVPRAGPDLRPRGAMATAFSSDGEAALRRELGPAAAATPRGDLDGFYEMGRAAAFVRGGGFRKVSGAGGGAGPGAAGRPSPRPHRLPPLVTPQVALQFPDELLADAAAVAARMEAATGAEMYVLGDTTYGRSVWCRGGCPGAPPRAGTGAERPWQGRGPELPGLRPAVPGRRKSCGAQSPSDSGSSPQLLCGRSGRRARGCRGGAALWPGLPQPLRKATGAAHLRAAAPGHRVLRRGLPGALPRPAEPCGGAERCGLCPCDG